MLDKVKLALRINNTAYDAEITDLINACKKELELAGIASSRIIETDAMIIRAVVVYCKANFGLGNNDSEKYRMAYENLKAFLVLCGEYNTPILVADVISDADADDDTETDTDAE